MHHSPHLLFTFIRSWIFKNETIYLKLNIISYLIDTYTVFKRFCLFQLSNWTVQNYLLRSILKNFWWTLKQFLLSTFESTGFLVYKHMPITRIPIPGIHMFILWHKIVSYFCFWVRYLLGSSNCFHCAAFNASYGCFTVLGRFASALLLCEAAYLIFWVFVWERYFLRILSYFTVFVHAVHLEY